MRPHNPCAAEGCVEKPDRLMRFPRGTYPMWAVPYCATHAIVVARAFDAEETDQADATDDDFYEELMVT